MPTSVKNQQGFTLLELLTVVAIMAIISGMSLMSHRDTQNYSKDQAVQAEMKQLAQAVRQYFIDQNDLMDVEGNRLQFSPADISFLTNPVFDPNDTDGDDDINDHDLHPWSVDYRTGWRGPYIKTGVVITPFVSIADSSNAGLEFNGLGDPTGDGDPDTGSVILVQAKPDPYSHPSDGDFFVWRTAAAIISNNNAEIPRLGRPYLFFDLVTYGTAQSKARIVSLGADGIYEFPLDCDPSETDNTDPDFCLCDLDQTDITHGRFCERDDICVAQGDDRVLCL